jgi:Secretion system C-terminal sorting domain
MDKKVLQKSLLFVAGFLFQFQASSQDMFVKSNTFVYASNQYIYIKDDLELNATTSNIYLRNNGQLLQGTTGSGANKGLGSLSVYQEGSSNNFQYNYWCSPVGGNSTATSVNNSFGINQLGQPTSLTTTVPATILVGNNYDGTASPLAISANWIYKFVKTINYSDWISVGASSTLAAGEGFTMKGSSGIDAITINGVQNNFDGKHQRYDFRGKPNDGTIEIPILPAQLTLTGNPYPSAIDLRAFLLAETNCTGIAYFWEQDKTVDSHYVSDYKGGYATYNTADIYVPAIFYTYDGSGNTVTTLGSSGNNFERKYTPIGQGFFIEGSTTVTGNVQMKNSYRAFRQEGLAYNSQFDRRAENKKNASTASSIMPQIWFNVLLDNGPVSQAVMTFDSSATDGFDRALDAASVNDGPANNYFLINDKEYVINTVSFQEDKKIPIGFRNTAQANYKITVNQMLNVPQITNVYLHDKTTDVYYDIKNSFHDLTLPAGTHNSRYEITFSKTTLGLKEQQTQSVLVHQDNKNKSLVIDNSLQLDLDNCSLYDVVGKLIFSKDKLGNKSSYTFSTASLRDGIYIAKLTANNKTEVGTKIIVKN